MSRLTYLLLVIILIIDSVRLYALSTDQSYEELVQHISKCIEFNTFLVC